MSKLWLLLVAATAVLAVVRRRRPRGHQSYGSAQSQVLSTREMSNAESKWLLFTKVMWADHRGVVREWEKFERRKPSGRNANSGVDGVMILARIVGGKYDGCVPLVKQFRPCLGRFTLELPAGLVDAGETVLGAALRELREETGLVAKENNAISITPPVFLDPGVSNTSCAFVTLEVDGTREENANPKQALEEMEDCQVLYLHSPTIDGIIALARENGDLALQSDVFYAAAAAAAAARS